MQTRIIIHFIVTTLRINMTPEEKIIAAKNLEQADKIPFMCRFGIGHMLLQLNVSPSEFYFNPPIYPDGLITLKEIY